MFHIVKGFGIVSKAEVDIFLELSFFIYDPTDVGNLISGSSINSQSIPPPPHLPLDNHKLWKILKEMEIQDHLTASWETCMQVKMQQLELDMEQ